MSMSLGIGVSGGAYYHSDGFIDGPGEGWDQALWSNHEADITFYGDSGLFFRAFGGLSYLLNQTPDRCSDENRDPICGPYNRVNPWLPYAGVGVGYSL